MIQINLIPDIKREMIRAQNVQRTAISISITVGIIAVAIVVLLGGVLGGQELRTVFAKNNIKNRYDELKSINNVNNILTLQNQLTKVTSLNDKKSMDSRIFDILSVVNPAAPNNVSYSSIKVDPTTATITIEGSAQGGYAATEAFRKTILNTKVETTQDGTTNSVPLTDDVKVNDTSYGQAADGSQVLRFSMQFVYPNGMLDNQFKSLRIVSPTAQVDVTDSNTRVPEGMFSQKASDVKAGN